MGYIVKTHNSIYIIDDKNNQLFKMGDAHWKLNYSSLYPVLKGMPLTAVLSDGKIFRTSPVESIGLSAI